MANKEAHHFWTKPNNFYDPKAQFRFRVSIPGMGLQDARPRAGTAGFADETDASSGHVWWAKTIDKPGYSVVDINKDRYYNQLAKANPVINSLTPNLKPVTMTLIDPVYPNTTRKLLRYLRRGGFQEQTAYNNTFFFGGPSESYIKTNSAGGSTGGFPRVQIEQLSSTGDTLEIWTLINAYPAEVDFGKLDYSSDDLVEITVTWGYQTFTCEFPEQGNEQAFTYFKDVGQTLANPPESLENEQQKQAFTEALQNAWNNLPCGVKKLYGDDLEKYKKENGIE